METQQLNEQSVEMWQVDVNGQVYDTNFDEMIQWVAEGALLPGDLVRRGNLRWLPAGKIPKLIAIFNAKDNGTLVTPPVVTTTTADTEAQPAAYEHVAEIQNFAPQQNSYQSVSQPAEPVYNQPIPASQFHNPAMPADACVIHADAAPEYYCGTCGNHFCRPCLKSYGGAVKTCPMCGAMCKQIAEAREKRERAAQLQKDMAEGFGFSDFGRALAYPVKFKSSLFWGAIFYAFFSIGQGAAAMGGYFMIAAALICMMLANMLTFGVLANTVENFTVGKTKDNFMPSFTDFSIWDSVVHPFFVWVGVIVSSFGPFVLIVVISLYYFLSSVMPPLVPGQDPKSLEAAKVIPGKINEINNAHMGDINRMEDGGDNPESNIGSPNSNTVGSNSNTSALPKSAADEEKYFEEMNNTINQTRKSQLESSIGKTPETVQAEYAEMIKSFFKMAVPVLILAFVALLWGLFYFPAACTVAGYTQSFWSAVNPAYGLDTIKRIGVDYLKILVMCVILVVIAGTVDGFLNSIFYQFDMPRLGNIPAKAFGSLFGFYIFAVFSVVLGSALYKNAQKLNFHIS